MNILDFRTILFGYLVSNAVCVLFMASLWHRHRQRSPEMLLWLAGFAMQFLMILLVFLRGMVPDFFSIILSYALAVGGILLLYIGLERYLGKTTSQRHNFIALALLLLIHAYFTYAQDSLVIRTINLSLGLLLICAQCAWLLLRRTEAEMRPATRLAGMIVAAFCLASMVRIVFLLTLPEEGDLLKFGWYNALVILCYQMLFVALTFSLFLMVNRRLLTEVEADNARRKQNESILKLQAERAQALLELPLAAEQLDENAFMQRGQELAEQLTSSQIAFIHFVNDDEQTIELVNWSHRTIEHYCKAVYDKHYPVSQAGIWADALRQRAPVVFNDYPNAPGRRGLPAGHSELLRFICVPVIDNGKVVMLTGVGNKKTSYNDLDVESVQLISDAIWRTIRRHRYEEALRTANEQLKLRTAEAESANHAKDDFLAMVSHEIRTPMNGVLGMTSLLLDTGLSDDQKSYAEIVKSSANSLLTIINDILDFSKIDAGKLQISNTVFQLDAVLDNLADLLAFRAREIGIQYAHEIDPHIPADLRGDPERLRQILLNLAGNALKFTRQGEVRVRVLLISADETRCELHFEVSDTGIGINRENLQNLFIPFSQVDASITRKYGGTGLGLAICKRLVELMGGEIGVESQPGAGSVFWFNLGFERESCSATHPETATPFAEMPAMLEERRLRVLLVDDQPANLLVARGLLHKLGVTDVVSVENGQQALEACVAETFDLILMDLQMPVMDGDTATRQLRESGCRTPIIAITAHAISGIAEKCRQSGMNDYLAKPLDIAELGRVICRCLPVASSAQPG